MTKPLTNPYAESTERHPVQVQVSQEDWTLVASLVMQRGLVPTILSILFRKLALECKQQNLTHYDPTNIPRLQEIVHGFQFRPSNEHNQGGSSKHVRGPTPSLGSESPATPSESSGAAICSEGNSAQGAWHHE